MVRKKKRASNPRKNIALTAKEIESSSSPNKISKSHTSKMETVNEIKIKQEENLDAEEEELQQPITIIKNDIRFEDLQTFFQKYSLEIPIQKFIRNFESTCDSFDIPEKQKILFIIKLKDNEIYPPLEEARKLAKERTEQYYKINKIRYDKKFQEADFKVGDLVMYEEFQYPNTRKLSPPYSGPYTVLRKCSDVLFEIDRPNALNKTDTELVHSVRLRHFHPSENFQLNYIQQNTPNNERR
ncbi:retrotransposable element Tf2 protein type 1 [Trichonephila clavipes]|uniref:Retrotransposable element Tf2 protein type 1 n=1 Tax=Trichonephila clavipes TaxID=2585209 RepID=A0A8X7B8W5_TRICX|nr:retrotransposable element Tf2 protein type 1 [Trichonephila clavipes]